MIGVTGATQENLKAVFRLRLAFRRVRLAPISLSLRLNCLDDHGNGLVKGLERLLLWWRMRIAKLAVPVPHVPRFRDACAEVITQVAGQVQHQVPHAVSVRVWFLPELFVTQRVNPLVQMFRDILPIVTETISRPAQKSSTPLPLLSLGPSPP